MFTLDRVQFRLPAPLVTMAVSNNIMLLALETNRLLRIDLQKSHEIEEIEIPRRGGDDRLHKLHFDPTGRHALLTTRNGENYYVFAKWKKAKPLAKLRGIVIESIAWNKLAGTRMQENSTRAILLGTNQGRVMEAEIEPTEEYFKREDRYVKLVYSLPKPDSITGLRCEPFPTDARRRLVLLTTPTRIYQFIGEVTGTDGLQEPVYGALFSNYESVSAYQEMPDGLGHSELHLFGQNNDPQSTPEKFAWLVGPGVYHGNLVFGSQAAGDSVIDNAKLLPYPPRLHQTPPTGPDAPLSFALTEFHFVMLFNDRLLAVCQLNNEVVYEEPLAIDLDYRRLVVDPIKRTYWAYTGASIYELIVEDEDRDVWRLYLKSRAYDTALRFCKDASQRDHVRTAQANHYFDTGRYLLSADYYAQTAVPFEEVVLKFVGKDERDALRQYLLCKLANFRKSDPVQATLICTWLVEIYINKLNILEDQASVNYAEADMQSYQEEERLMREEFQAFLEQNKTRLDRRTTYQLIESHARKEELVFFSNCIGDYDRLVSFWIEEGNWPAALEVLAKHGTIDMFYKYSPSMMEHLPQELISNQAIRYLKFVVGKLGNVDPVVHNYLVTLFAAQAGDNEAELLSFIGAEDGQRHYNLDYALRVCLRHNRLRSCVLIYGLLEQFEEAVDLALASDDLELARINADKPVDDEDLRKQLWLKIVRHVIQEKGDVRMAMQYLQHCSLIKIEDVLPFFPDFALIDDFKASAIGDNSEYGIT
ncbi:Pep3/Vps18/deep orange family-domain-containing protein [Thamnocephalis sphaerospora]|uniref:Pep3/Vps18/deep orange family-domain-containing protein n=1 Tax=Thamnocephalis sphaerospora TaxID=78915 RepID=A0A4P9XUK0_9FUNG|nr:Pep3/Vps18/deep orange family-domain-containing protein [Thamnocephalis sphaerospora]|eukprot:RKP09914.1 Pep3/Vps18/deep orange family-domain-containing protein [Thamnocephalis sphaerospora]